MNLKLPIYLDYSSTTPMDSRVFEAMKPYFTELYGNASSKDHFYGDISKQAVEEARQKVANLINAESDEIIFTSGATEAINLGLIGTYLEYRHRGNHIITAATEHKAVLETINYLESIGAKVTILSVNEEGMISLEELEKQIQEETVLISAMHINNETGVKQDIERIGKICAKNNIYFFCDISQSAGKVDVDVMGMNISLASISAHKMYGPKGTGALYKPKNIKINPLNYGGGQEKGIRSGTYNTPAIIGFGEACEIALKEKKANYTHVEKIHETFIKEFISGSGNRINGNVKKKTPYIVNVLFDEYDAQDLILRFRKDFSVSTGSACNSEIVSPSHVLIAMGLDNYNANKSIRFSFGKQTTQEEINKVLELIKL